MSRQRNPKNWCLKCDSKCKNSRSNLCQQCWQMQKSIDFGKYQIDDFKASSSRHRFQSIRNHARRIMVLSNTEKKCSVCGYHKHVEVAHVKSISSFEKESSLEEVNHLTNLVYLCPNCHWEQENGLLVVS